VRIAKRAIRPKNVVVLLNLPFAIMVRLPEDDNDTGIALLMGFNQTAHRRFRNINKMAGSGMNIRPSFCR